jgi:hypothetical protein
MKKIRNLLILGTAFVAIAAVAHADALKLTTVAQPNAKVEGASPENAYSPEFKAAVVAEGKMKLENPTKLISHYGYNANGPLVPAAGDVQAKGHNVEANKTEPDKNTYLVLQGLKGADAAYNYGTHFVFQGHEGGSETDDKPDGYITRVNLDADEAHRVTLLADKDSGGTKLPFIDGSTWNPFAQRLLFTGEEGDEGGVWQGTLDFPAKVDNLTGIIGIGSYEGIQTDKDGNIWIVEDEGGKGGEKTKNAKQPNSFVFRFVPTDKADLMKGGKLQALQIMTADGKPIVFTKDNLDGDILSDGMKQHYAYGTALKTKWVLVHDTAKDGTTPFKANDMAKAAMATPLKRPENGVFRPGSDFKQFYYTETGDTNIETEAKEEFGGFGGVFKIEQASNTADEGTVSIVYRGTKDRSGFDNIQFASADTLFVVEDAGDKLHSQRKFLDNGYAFDLTQDYGKGGEPVRFLAEGRDASATIDSALSAVKDTGFQNDGDNEITGIHVSDGDATAAGLLGAKVPNLADKAWRVFFHQQHGENRLVELSYTAAK